MCAYCQLVLDVCDCCVVCVSEWASFCGLAAAVCSSQGDLWCSSLGFIFSSERGSTAGQRATVKACSLSLLWFPNTNTPPTPTPPPPPLHTFSLPFCTCSSLFYSNSSPLCFSYPIICLLFEPGWGPISGQTSSTKTRWCILLGYLLSWDPKCCQFAS